MNETELEKLKIAFTSWVILRPGKSCLFFFTRAGAIRWFENQREEGKDTTGWVIRPTEKL